MVSIARGLALAAAVWVAAIVAAPVAIHGPSTVVSRGAAAVYLAASLVCHQRPERSFSLQGRPLAVCARCAALYVAALAGGVCALLLGIAAPEAAGARLLLALAALPTLATWSIEHAGIAPLSNVIRALAALPLGFAAGALVIGILLADARPAPVPGRV